MHGVVCVDANGTPLSHAITWMDRRSADLAAAWRADGTAAELYRETGAPMHPMLPIAKIRWLAEHAARVCSRRTARFVGLKELFVYRWSGAWVVDWGIAGATGMFGLGTRAWSPRALDLARIGAERLATPVAPSTALPPLRDDVARELGLRGSDVLLVLTSSDGALANIGSGAAGDDLAVTLGTSGAARTLASEPHLDDRGRTFCYPADDRRFVVGGPTSSAGASLDWMFALLLDEVPKEQRFARAAALAAEVAPGANGCVVLPFLAGERAPYWNAALRGAIGGLELAHDRRTILRAAIESVVFGVFAVYEAMRERTGPAARLVLSGGLTEGRAGARDAGRRLLAMPAVEPHQQEALGASAPRALLGRASAPGLIPDASAAAQRERLRCTARTRSRRTCAARIAEARYATLPVEPIRRQRASGLIRSFAANGLTLRYFTATSIDG